VVSLILTVLLVQQLLEVGLHLSTGCAAETETWESLLQQ